MNQQRIAWIDYARTLGIIGVLTVHTCLSASLSKLIYVALIPLFFFVSGIFASHDEVPFRQFIRRKCRRLVVPYIFFNVVTFLVWYFVTRHFGNSRFDDESFYTLLRGLLYGTAHSLVYYVPLWFLGCLLSTHVVYYGLMHISSRITIRMILSTLAAILGLLLAHFNVDLPFTFPAALVLVLFYCGGDVWSRSNVQLSTWRWGIILLLSILAVSVSVYYNDKVSFHIGIWGHPMLMLTGSTGGVCLCIAVCKLLSRWPLRIVSYIGQNTITILCTHLIVYSAIKGVYIYVFNGCLDVFSRSIGSLALLIFTIVAELPIIAFINRFIPIAVGNKKQLIQ